MIARQSKAVIPSRSTQDTMTRRWETEPLPLYLICDPGGNALRVYKDLNRARNWTAGTNRRIRYNDAATELDNDRATRAAESALEGGRESGNANLVLVASGAVVLYAIYRIMQTLGLAS